MIETEEFRALLRQNRALLARHAERHDLSGVKEIDIGSRFENEDIAMDARRYIKAKYSIPQSILFRVSTTKYSDDDITIELKFSIEAVPDAEVITKYEFMLQDAAEKFGGEPPGWEIAVKPT